MKAILSWLGDPYLHLLGVGAIVVGIGVAGSSRGDVGEPCDLCHRTHDDSNSCLRVVVGRCPVHQWRLDFDRVLDLLDERLPGRLCVVGSVARQLDREINSAWPF